MLHSQITVGLIIYQYNFNFDFLDTKSLLIRFLFAYNALFPLTIPLKFKRLNDVGYSVAYYIKETFM